MRVLRCRDVGVDCDAEIVGESDSAVLAQAAEHARAVYSVEVTPERGRAMSVVSRRRALSALAV